MKPLKQKRLRRAARRKGTPLTIYFSEAQFNELDAVSHQRGVAKATIVRFAVNKLFGELNDGQLDLPLGLQLNGTAVSDSGPTQGGRIRNLGVT